MTAARVRLGWDELPEVIRAAVSARTGPVTGVVSHEGGYSPGMAATLTTADGDRVFVKAVSSSFHERSAELYRAEARVNALLPDGTPAPRMRWTFDDGEWVALGFDAADGDITLPWDEPTLDAVVQLYDELALVPGPAELPAVPDELARLAGWPAGTHELDVSSWDPWVGAHLEELVAISDRYGDRTRGDRLVHLDARRDNMIRLGGRILLVDWPYAAVGAPWVDLLVQLPSIGVEGGGDPAPIWERAGVSRLADPDDVTAVLAGVTGYFVCSSALPPPVGVPHVRAFQRAQGEVALTWLRQRLEE